MAKKLVMMIPTAGKTKEEIKKEAVRVLREKGMLKEEKPDRPPTEDELWEDAMIDALENPEEEE